MREPKKVYVLEYRSVVDGTWAWRTSIDAPVFRKKKDAQHWRNATETRASRGYRISRFDRHK